MRMGAAAGAAALRISALGIEAEIPQARQRRAEELERIARPRPPAGGGTPYRAG
jgi:hypothetical protein